MGQMYIFDNSPPNFQAVLLPPSAAGHEGHGHFGQEGDSVYRQIKKANRNTSNGCLVSCALAQHLYDYAYAYTHIHLPQTEIGI